jgi:hypothetical protein
MGEREADRRQQTAPPDGGYIQATHLPSNRHLNIRVLDLQHAIASTVRQQLSQPALPAEE